MLRTSIDTTTERQELAPTTDESALVFALHSEGRLDEARRLSDELLPGTEGDERTALLITRAVIERGAGNYGLALMLLESCEAQSPALRGALHNGLAISCRNLGRLDRALIEYVGAAEYFAQVGNEFYAARVENNIANVLIDLGRPDEAHEFLDRAAKVLTSAESLGELHDTRSRAFKAVGRKYDAT